MSRVHRDPIRCGACGVEHGAIVRTIYEQSPPTQQFTWEWQCYVCGALNYTSWDVSDHETHYVEWLPFAAYEQTRGAPSVRRLAS